MPDTPHDAFINGSVEGSRFDHRPTMPDTPELTPASVAFLLAHKDYPGCTMASLTIREHLEQIEAEVRRAHIDALTAAVRALPEADTVTGAYYNCIDRATVLAILKGEPTDPDAEAEAEFLKPIKPDGP